MQGNQFLRLCKRRSHFQGETPSLDNNLLSIENWTFASGGGLLPDNNLVITYWDLTLYLLARILTTPFVQTLPQKRTVPASMTNTAAETSRPVGVTIDMIDNQQSEEEHAAEYMQGWALASLTVAFMSICFCAGTGQCHSRFGRFPFSGLESRNKQYADLIMCQSNCDTPDHQRLPKF